MNPVHNLKPHFPKIHSNVIFPFTPKSYERSLPSGSPTKIMYEFLMSFMHATCHAYLFFLDLITLCWAADWAIGVLGFDSRRGLGIFLFTAASRTVLWPTQPPIQWVTGALSLGVKRPGHEADHSPPSSAEVKKCMELYLHASNTSSWRGA
jgi:hypothetical protein